MTTMLRKESPAAAAVADRGGRRGRNYAESDALATTAVSDRGYISEAP